MGLTIQLLLVWQCEIMNNDINLIQGEKANVARKKRILVLRILSLVFIFSVAFFSIILFILNNRISPENVRKDENSTLQRILLFKDRSAKFNLVSDRLKSITTVLDNRKKYTEVLNTILEQVPPNVKLTGLTIDKDTVLVTAISVSLLSEDKFLNNFTSISQQKHVVKNMIIEGLTLDKQTGIYSLSLKATSL